MTALSKLFYIFFQIGLFSIGGGYAVIPLIQEQVVTKYAWISPQTFTDILTISQMTPGPIAVNTSTFVGLQIAGFLGAIFATVGCVAAGVCISVILHRFFQRHQNSIYVSEVLRGLKASSTGLIASAAVTILMLTFMGDAQKQMDWASVVLFLCSLFILRKFKMNPILLMLLTGAAGFVIYWVFRASFL